MERLSRAPGSPGRTKHPGNVTVKPPLSTLSMVALVIRFLPCIGAGPGLADWTFLHLGYFAPVIRTSRSQVSDMRNVEPGFRVVGSDGTEVGTVASCDRQSCRVNTGILGLGSPIYVPMDAIQQTEGDTVYLNVPSDRIEEMGWSQPPVGAAESCTTGYNGTLPSDESTGSMPSGPTTRLSETSRGKLSPAVIESVQPGWSIICAEGKEIGKVASARPDGLVMDRGRFIFRYRAMVPANTIREIDDVHHLVYLSVDCAAVDRFHSV